MQDELLFLGAASIGIEFLRILGGPESGKGNGLGFTASE